jgi:hypothetical protein
VKWRGLEWEGTWQVNATLVFVGGGLRLWVGDRAVRCVLGVRCGCNRMGVSGMLTTYPG